MFLNKIFFLDICSSSSMLKHEYAKSELGLKKSSFKTFIHDIFF